MFAHGFLAYATAVLLGYFLGAIPFGLFLTRVTGGPDIRNIGSGNIGATNVLRTGRKGLAAATLLCDIFKGTLAVLAADYFFGHVAGLAAGFGAFLGHLFPVWLRFKGGKGVATYIGVCLAVAWPVALLFGGVWAVVAAVTRYSSLSALVASAATPFALWLYGTRNAALLFALMTALLWLMHRANIRRLISGAEDEIGTRTAPPR